MLFVMNILVQYIHGDIFNGKGSCGTGLWKKFWIYNIEPTISIHFVLEGYAKNNDASLLTNTNSNP